MDSHSGKDHQVPSEALIYHNGIPVAIVPTKGIHRQGMDVNCGPMHFERNTRLEVEMVFDPDRRSNRFRVPAHVEECTRNHMALHFDEIPEAMQLVLQRLKQAREVRSGEEKSLAISH